MRRLLILVCVVVAVDTMLFTALTPLLGHFARTLHLSSGGAGALVAAYAAGVLVGGLPGGVAASRMGPRRAVLVGLTLMGIASLAFAWSDSYWSLMAARFLQGCGSSFTWAGAFAWLIASAPRERRGEMIGTAMGAAVFGALFGPVVGSLAALLGRGAVFSSVALVAAVLAAMTLQIPTRPPERPSAAALRRAVTNQTFVAGLGLLALGALLFGVLDVLVPLHLNAAGWAPAAIGAVFLVGAALETAQSPLIGRLSDRHGPLVPVRYALAGATIGSLALVSGAEPLLYSAIVVVVSVIYGALFTPAFALIANGAEAAGLAQGLAFGIMNAAWALGAVAGPAAGGALAGAAGDDVAFAVAAAACAGAFALVRRRTRLGVASAAAEL